MVRNLTCKRLPIGDANATSSNVVWTCIVAFIFLGEKIHWADLVAIPLNIAGVLLLSQPSFLFDDTIFYTRGKFSNRNSYFSFQK